MAVNADESEHLDQNSRTAERHALHTLHQLRRGMWWRRTIPLSDGMPARRFPLVNVMLIAANFAVFSVLRTAERGYGG